MDSVSELAEHLHKLQNKISITEENKEINEYQLGLWVSMRTKVEAKIKKYNEEINSKRRELQKLDEEYKSIMDIVEDNDIVKLLQQALTAQPRSAEYFEAKKRFNQRLKNE